MQLTKTIQFNGSTITLRQLTVRQVRELLVDTGESTDEEKDLEDMFIERLPFAAVRLSSGIDARAMLADGVTQADLDTLVREVAKLNPSLARLIERRIASLADTHQILSALQQPLTRPSAA